MTHSSRHFPPVAVHNSYHLSRNDAHGIAAASPASRRERQERSHPIQYRDFQNGSGPAGGHGHSDSNHQGVGASAGISHPDRRMTKVTARIPPHDESQNSESFGRENSNVSCIQHGFHGSSSEQWRRRKNHMCRYTPSAARRQEQRRTKQEQRAESQKLKSECMECKTKDDTIQKLKISTSTLTASFEDEKFQQQKSMNTKEQLKKQVDELAKDCALKEKQLAHKELALVRDEVSISQKSDISPLTGIFPGDQIPESDVEADLTRLLSECKQKDKEIQALREGIDPDRRELDTAELLDTPQRAPAEAPDEIDPTRKKIQDLKNEIVRLKNQLTSSRSSDSAILHQGREASSQLASKSEKIQQLHHQLHTLRKKHEDNMQEQKQKKESLEEDLAAEVSNISSLKQERNRLSHKFDHLRTQIRAIYDEVRKHDEHMVPLQYLFDEDVGKVYPTQVYSEFRVVRLVQCLILQFQKEVEETTLEMKTKEREVAEMRLQMARTKAEIEWHETYFGMNEQERAQRDQYLKSIVQDITPSVAENSNEESVFKSRGGSIEGRKVSLSGEKQSTHPSRDRESKHRRDHGKKEK